MEDSTIGHGATNMEQVCVALVCVSMCACACVCCCCPSRQESVSCGYIGRGHAEGWSGRSVDFLYISVQMVCGGTDNIKSPGAGAAGTFASQYSVQQFMESIDLSSSGVEGARSVLLHVVDNS